MGRSLDRSGGDTFEDEEVKVGKKTCTCSFAFVVANGKVKKATGACDKKCSGAVKKMTLNSDDYAYTFWIQCQEGQGQDGQGFCCWGLCWRFWRIWRIWNAWRFRNARRRIRPFWMCLRPHAQRHGDWRLRDAPNATNGIWIRNWRLRIWCHSTSSHWWQWNR